MSYNVIDGLTPYNVFRIFRDITTIPHGSSNTSALREYCAEYAAERGLKCVKDDCGNILISVPASNGSENKEPLIIQGHLDMVCEKLPEKEIDFLNDPLELKRDGDFLFADSTTLGGDDGVAVAMALALIDEDIPHPPLEILFTADEETGMNGADGFDVLLLKGKRLLNLDSEDGDTIWVSCAGGIKAEVTIPLKREIKSSDHSFEVTVKGLVGGHSGTEIDKGRYNAVILLAKLLKETEEKADIHIHSIDGGAMDNAIPREASARFLCNDAEAVKSVIAEFTKKVKDNENDPDVEITYTDFGFMSASEMTVNSKNSLLDFLSNCPNGVIAMSEAIEGLVQTSLNLGVIKTRSNSVDIHFALRSSVNREKEALAAELEKIASSCGGKTSFNGNYPAWEYNEISVLRDVYAEVYKEKYGSECTVRSIHAGLECGIFYDKIKGLDCISVGPDIFDIHTPQERLSISSLAAMYELIREVVKRLS